MLKKLKLISQNKDARVIFENFISLTVLKILGYVFPIITMPYLAKIIGVEGFGEIALAASVITYFVTITEYGFSYTAVRDIAKNRGDLDRISHIFSAVLFSKVLLMLLCAFILLILTYTIPYFIDKRQLLWLTFLCIPGYIIFPDWFFQAQEQMKYSTILNLLLKLIFTFLVFVVIKEKQDYIYQPLLLAAGTFTSGIAAFVLIFCKFKVKIVHVSLSSVFTMLKNGRSLFLSLLFPNLYNNFSTILLGYFGGIVSTGVFSSGKFFIDLLDQVSGVLSRTFYPFLARRIDKHSLYVKISGSISILMSIFLFAFADILVSLFYTNEFTSSVTVIRIMAICPVALFLGNCYGTNYLILIGKEKLYQKIVLYNSLFGFILSFFSIREWGYVGAAITITTVRITIGVTTWYYANRYKNNIL